MSAFFRDPVVRPFYESNYADDRMLDDLGHRVDGTESKLGGAMHRMRRFIRETEGEFQVS